MCKGGSECVDKVCCSLRNKAWFFSFWTIVHGVIFTAFHANRCYTNEEFLCLNMTAIKCGLALSILHLTAGLCLLCGIWKLVDWLFMTGLILSSFMPYILLVTIYLPAVQIFFTIALCRYYRKVLD